MDRSVDKASKREFGRQEGVVAKKAVSKKAPVMETGPRLRLDFQGASVMASSGAIRRESPRTRNRVRLTFVPQYARQHAWMNGDKLEQEHSGRPPRHGIWTTLLRACGFAQPILVGR
jgi:hypothetical protein